MSDPHPDTRWHQHLEADVQFGSSGNAEPYLRDGWSSPEPGFTWAVDQASSLQLPLALKAAFYFLEIRIRVWFRVPTLWPQQRLKVRVNGRPVGHAIFGADAIPALGFCFSGGFPPSSETLITFEHPDAKTPTRLPIDAADGRNLSFAFQRVRLFSMPVPAKPIRRSTRSNGVLLDDAPNRMISGLSPVELMAQFQSIGDNCECGFVQQYWGIDPPGLFRFCNIRIPAILQGLDVDFKGIGGNESSTVYCSKPGFDGRREILITDETYGYYYHTNLYEDEISLEEAKERHIHLQRNMRRQFLDCAAEASYIFVHRIGETPFGLANVIPLFFALRRRGPNTLLCIVPEDDLHPSGSVEMVTEGLLIGYVDKLSNLQIEHDISYDEWLRVFDNALIQRRSWPG